MHRIDHILVVVDPTAGRRQAAVDRAALLAGCSHASVELLICDIAAALDDRLGSGRRQTHPSNTELLDLLEALAIPLRALAIKAAVRIIYGNSLHEALLDYIRGCAADLVIKDSHRHFIARRVIARNTDWYLARSCPVPLLLTKKKAWGQPPIVVTAVDFSHANEQVAKLNHHILEFAASMTGRLKGDLHIIHSYIPTAFAAIVSAGRQSTGREYSEAVQVENSFRCCQIASLGSKYGVTPEHLHVEMGTPRDCLKHAVDKYNTDLVVMGASSHKWRRMVMGSTAASILQSLNCDVLIVRPDALAQSVPC